MKRWAVIGTKTDGTRSNIFESGQTYSRRGTAQVMLTRWVGRIDAELTVEEVEVITETEMLDWMIANGGRVGKRMDGDFQCSWDFGGRSGFYKAPREAIKAAMKEG